MTEASKQGKGLSWTSRPDVKGLAAYLMILVVVSLLLVGVKLNFTDSMVIYAQKDKSDFMQVFFPINDTYSEDNSVQSTIVKDQTNGIKIPLPRTSIDHVRIDPASEAAEIVITKIELKHLFRTETLMPIDLIAHVKPIMMIDKLEIIPSGLLIHSTGNDPAFELRLNEPLNETSGSSQIIIFGIISVFLSFAVFLGIKKLSYLKMPEKTRNIFLLTIPLWVSLGVAALFYPGFMSYDTLHALRSARSGVTDSMWPPMVSYVWRAVNLISLNPSAMHFSQVFLLLFSVFIIVFLFTNKIRYATAFLVIYLSIPVVLGTIAVIWKDVLMAAFFLAGFAIIVSMRLVKSKWFYILLSMIAAFLIFLGVCSRHNAITGAVPLLFYLAFVVCSRVLKKPLRLWLGVILLGSALTIALFVTKTQLDNYSLPGFERLSNSNDLFIRYVRVLDVAGASLCVGGNLFADMAPNLSLTEIMSLYDPKHVNLSKGLLDRVGIDSRIDKIWLNVAIHHPICFFNNKFQLAKYLIGANKGAQFLVTAPAIDNNEYGYSLPKSSLRDAAVAYIFQASQLSFFKPWFLYLISIAAFIYMVLVRALTAGYLTIFISALLYFAGLVAFGNAADARLLFYTTTLLSLFIFISILEFKKRRANEKVITNLPDA
jgi:hypothetical protein